CGRHGRSRLWRLRGRAGRSAGLYGAFLRFLRTPRVLRRTSRLRWPSRIRWSPGLVRPPRFRGRQRKVLGWRVLGWALLAWLPLRRQFRVVLPRFTLRLRDVLVERSPVLLL